ncbi:MAG: electron transfer flavoprotein subunit alpha/FixB family protein [Desulfobacterales bacterium]|jgi:electron transfer flavoprotein alpha subunit
MKPTIVVIVEHLNGEINPVSHELVGFAQKLQQISAAGIRAIIVDNDPATLAREVAERWGLDVTAVQVPGLTAYNSEIYQSVLTELLGEFEAAWVCSAHSSQGMDFAAALSVKLKAACVTGVEEILEDQGRICFAKSIFGAKAVAYIRSEENISILTIQPGIFKSPKSGVSESGKITLRSLECNANRTHSLGIKRAEADTTGITEADIIVSAGQGIGDKENVDLLHRLAGLFAKSSVAGSRIVCDLGWLEYRCQVGVTGATVSPRLYMACGISGAFQHVVGMRNSECIVAINNDPAAAIFQIADICIVEDLTTFIPAFIETYEKIKTEGDQND